MLICGLDEAGRGPVIGPMVLCGVLINEEDEIKLKQIKVKDSKLLTPNQRERLYDKIIRIAKYKLIMLKPIEIDQALNSDSQNLNWLEADNMAVIINALNPDKAYIDCPSNNIKNFTQYLKKRIKKKKKVEIIAEHKADVKYPIVSAASILAKVTRDRAIENLKKKIKQDFGSGYMSDTKTAEFLKNNFEKYPDIFRKSWISFKTVLNNKNQRKLEEF